MTDKTDLNTLIYAIRQKELIRAEVMPDEKTALKVINVHTSQF